MYQRLLHINAVRHASWRKFLKSLSELLLCRSSMLKPWAPLLQRFPKSHDEQARATFACMHACLVHLLAYKSFVTQRMQAEEGTWKAHTWLMLHGWLSLQVEGFVARRVVDSAARCLSMQCLYATLRQLKSTSPEI